MLAAPRTELLALEVEDGKLLSVLDDDTLDDNALATTELGATESVTDDDTVELAALDIAGELV